VFFPLTPANKGLFTPDTLIIIITIPSHLENNMQRIELHFHKIRHLPSQDSISPLFEIQIQPAQLQLFKNPLFVY
jgi:hypothetical protein